MADTPTVEMMSKEAGLKLVEDRVSEALASLEGLFVPGVTLTLVARHPTNPDAHFVVTREKTIRTVIGALEETIQSRAEAGL